mmetsp:Transcript_41163/g.97077  ORF Transcript_41163/g.97077 Transcript_41163/m.97077 type:complete len:194 (+) Transcript_41163:3-584(+)
MLLVAAGVLLAAETTSAANICYNSTAIVPTKNTCKDLSVTPRFCAATAATGLQLAKDAAAYLDSEAITTTACIAWYDTMCEAAGGTKKTLESCDALCSGGLAYCTSDKDCVSDSSITKLPNHVNKTKPQPMCCKVCEQTLAKNCEDVTELKAYQVCRGDKGQCTETACSSGATSRPTLLFIATTLLSLFALRH